MRCTTLVSLLAIAAACGGGKSSPPPAAPRLRLTGQLERATPGSPATPLRLAMAWYPDFGAQSPASAVRAVVPQPGVTFEGAFPIRFSFEVEGPPPAQALSDLSAAGGSGHVAYGVLIAYQDGNGNGTFDTIPRGGAPVDTIVGLSVADPSLPPPVHSWFVVYLDGRIAPGDTWDGLSLEQGYNLLRANSNFGIMKVPLESDVTIPITATAALNVYACPDVFASGFLQRACGIDPYGGKYQAMSNLFATAAGTTMWLAVVDADGVRADAAVTVDGTDSVAWDGVGSYAWSGPTLSGAHALTIAVPGYPTETLPFTVPGQLSVTAPASGQTLKRGAAVPISWTAAAGVAYYDIYFLTDDATGAWLFHDLPAGTSVTTPPIVHVGPARLTVKAIGAMGVGDRGSFLTPVSQDTVTVTFAP